MKKGLRTLACIVVIATFLGSLATGCGQTQKQETSSTTQAGSSVNQATAEESGIPPVSTEKMVNYSAYFDIETVAKWFDNPNDVVTKWYEDRFKLHCSDIYWQSGQTTDQRIATFMASNDFPDILVANRASVFAAINQGMDLTELAPKYMPYYWNNVVSDTLKKSMTVNGQVKFLYKYEAFGNDEKSGLNDPYFNSSNHTFMIREDILSKLGYKFTSIKDIKANCDSAQRAPTLDDFKIDPVPYKTADEFVEFLRKINNLALEDKSGNRVIPFSTTGWESFLLSAFDFSTLWKWNDETKKADGYLGSPEAKEAMHLWWKLYTDKDKLLDQDYIIQKLPQLQEKIATGRVAVFVDGIDFNAAKESLLKLDPTWDIRPIPLPSNGDNAGFVQSPIPYRCVLINKDLDPDTAVRLMKMWDFMNTEQGLDILCFGPPNELTEMKDGQKVFKEPLMSLVMQNKKDLPGGPDELGIVGLPGTYMKWGDYWSKVAYCSAAPRYRFNVGIERSMPPLIDVLAQGRRIFSIQRLPLTPNVAFPRGTDSNKPNLYYGTFHQSDISKLITAKTEDEFNSAWQFIMDQNEKIGSYSKAQKEMTDYFNSIGMK